MTVSEEIKQITDYIFLEPNIQKSDLALVFGTRHQEAVDKVYDLYKTGFITKILVSGGKNRVTGENESLEMSKKLFKLGVGKNDIILENKSTNSLENVIFSKNIIEEKIGLNNIKKIIIIAKNYHSRRAMMTARKYFSKTVELSLAVYEVYGFTKENWFKHSVGREKVMEEYNKIQNYLKKGDIVELF